MAALPGAVAFPLPKHTVYPPYTELYSTRSRGRSSVESLLSTKKGPTTSSRVIVTISDQPTHHSGDQVAGAQKDTQERQHACPGAYSSLTHRDSAVRALCHRTATSSSCKFDEVSYAMNLAWLPPVIQLCPTFPTSIVAPGLYCPSGRPVPDDSQ
ncbi:hypothetical protein BU24DRAFT_452318 [Aaosphaeria arxii CBS 175.79]|uniref:Uncharacterized protein n=1 Tax=Aaosphaeria arxii CBS 175.79 TaxID=1450172 RepID=A0A6A5XJH0_9PLEO|nr:uncharacterized protein BU24DRAFT_452318 [Aaosphaeria arxii CBS 175.79]KAF2013415.1 hypothetical protein BU24DRAFT_452318 [Aaosphaeria arxii CBS 175.79]